MVEPLVEVEAERHILGEGVTLGLVVTLVVLLPVRVTEREVLPVHQLLLLLAALLLGPLWRA